MGSNYTKRYTAEFKRDAVALVDSTGRTVTEVARELGVSPECGQHRPRRDPDPLRYHYLRPCSVRDQCTRSTQCGRQLTVRPQGQDANLERVRAEQGTDEWKDYCAVRAGVEGPTYHPGVGRHRLPTTATVGVASHHGVSQRCVTATEPPGKPRRDGCRPPGLRRRAGGGGGCPARTRCGTGPGVAGPGRRTR
ncbi:transposase [Streptomyces sp. NPDC059426]|uniref:transposase n=1 Tax=Streptomyces sp. NPDC059426 TaxID=3346827 RepID=UPI003678E5B9